MTNRLSLLMPFVAFAFQSCTQAPKGVSLEEVKMEIIQMEHKFRDDLQSKGVAYAFYTYAAPDAVIKRENDTLIIGSEAIKDYYSKSEYNNATVNWEADFTDISEDGTMAYTYGKYTWTSKGADSNKVHYSGVFHTVWKKQPDGSWKYVWD